MARVLSFLIRYFSNYYTLHRSDLTARAAPLDPRLVKRAGDLKSEEERNFLSAIVKSSKMREKISPGAKVVNMARVISPMLTFFLSNQLGKF